MSWNYYREQGYQQVFPKYREISNASTSANIVLWTPASSMRIAVTGASVSCNPGGTIAFFFGGNNSALKIAQYTIGASTTIYPEIDSWESTATDAPLYVNISTGTTNGYTITVEGFELE